MKVDGIFGLPFAVETGEEQDEDEAAVTSPVFGATSCSSLSSGFISLIEGITMGDRQIRDRMNEG